MLSDPMLARICNRLTSEYAVHTIFLYGSRADGSAGADSDYDLAGFGPVSSSFRIAQFESGSYLDVFVYQEAILSEPTEEHLKLRGSQVLMQRGTEGTAFLLGLDSLFRRGPQALPQDEIAARKVWAHKMALRIRRGDVEGDYRRVWLLTVLLEDYFHIRGIWYQGPKKALQWLREFDTRTYEAISVALKPNPSGDAISSLVQLVVGEPNA